MIIYIQFKDEITKDLGLDGSLFEGHVFKAGSYRTQKAENGMFFQIGVIKIIFLYKI